MLGNRKSTRPNVHRKIGSYLKKNIQTIFKQWKQSGPKKKIMDEHGILSENQNFFKQVFTKELSKRLKMIWN